MPQPLQGFLPIRPPTPRMPLLGRTVLLVEDSRFACDAIRLITLRSGARIRRAGTIEAAERHLRSYSPTVAIVDVGLPDGDGRDLIARLAAAQPRIPGLIATSGDDTLAAAALAAGADAVLPKPIVSVAAFQETVLACLPADLRPAGLRPVSAEVVVPDALALRDDLAHAAELLGDPHAGVDRGYLATFLGGLAKAAADADLGRAAASYGAGATGARASLASLIEARLAAVPAV